jgi:hypothetical protein
METQITQDSEKPQNIFENIEKTGEDFKQQFKELAIKAQKSMDSQINSTKFEAAYALSVSKKQRLQTVKEVKEVRTELWQEALKKANGNTNDASEIYENLCAFP